MLSLSHLLFTDPAISQLFAADAQVQAMLRVEAALARVQARQGLLPAAAADVIGAVCSEADWPLEALAAATLLAGNPAIPLVQELTRRVAGRDTEAARYVHLGATSQDILDTALVLQVKIALGHLGQQASRVRLVLAALARAHIGTPMVGRTLLQQARPLTFGYVAAGWLAGLGRADEELARLGAELPAQLGGAVGTLATLGAAGPAVAKALAAELTLTAPLLPWHGQREQLALLGSALATLVGSLGKLGQDVILLMQSEVAEVAEGAAPGKGGSSAMPHKRNPVRAVFLRALAERTPALAATLFGTLPHHELGRAAGAWHAEWEVLPQLLALTGAALGHALDLVAGLEVFPEQMRRNLDLTQGLIFAEDVAAALAPHLGRAAAHQLVAEASRAAAQAGTPLLTHLRQHTEAARLLGAAELAALFDPAQATGQSEYFTRAVLARYAPAPGGPT